MIRPTRQSLYGTGEHNALYAPPIGTKGTVKCVGDAGSIMVGWDDGSSLSVVFGVDKCRRIIE